MFYARPNPTSTALNSISFQVRTPWRLSQWSKLSISFMAENRNDLQLGSRRIDSAFIGGCGPRSQQMSINFDQAINVSPSTVVRLFLHGVSSSSNGGSAFELRLSNVAPNAQGATFTTSINGASNADHFYISYLVYDSNSFGIPSTDGVFERTAVFSQISQSLANNRITTFSYALYGLSSFEFSSQYAPHFSVAINSSLFLNVNGLANVQSYLAVSYFLVQGSCSSCPSYPYLNGANCVQNCPQGFPLNGICQSAPTCPAFSTWNGTACACIQYFYNISGVCQQCPPGTTYNGYQCIQGPTICQQNAFFNTTINQCQCNVNFYNISGVCQQCPQGTQWNGYQCVQGAGPCPLNANFNPQIGRCECIFGYYPINNLCQQCPPNTQWNGVSCALLNPPPIVCGSNSFLNTSINQCQCVVNFYNISGVCQQCAPGSQWNGYTCAPFFPPPVPCGANAVYNTSINQCQCTANYYNISGSCQQCPSGTQWNGQTCSGSIPTGPGIICPIGTNCVLLCSNYPNTVYNPGSNQCVCTSNTYYINGNCQACPNGWAFNGVTCVPSQQCPPNSSPSGSSCVCNQGYVQTTNGCVPTGVVFPPTPVTCADGMYFNERNAACVLCMDGCGSCSNGDSCNRCNPGYRRSSNGRCSEICGDGIRFVVSCDDGNTRNGDGCSSRCRVEQGWSCFGGSPTTPDSCTRGRPTSIMIYPTGQTHLPGKIVTNVRVSWLPTELSASGCKDCLDVRMLSSTNNARINSTFIQGTSYSFSIQFDFVREPISDFRFSVRINPSLQEPYFRGIDISYVATVSVTPSVLALNDAVETLDAATVGDIAATTSEAPSDAPANTTSTNP